jgi:wyosine [tRNA(Phe)-imidazoG37] synthetase (radical SAM superfamily)
VQAVTQTIQYEDPGQYDVVFGPVPSRRLGRSVGINNIPPKICSYACVYCQLGRTIRMQINRESFYSPADMHHRVNHRIEELRNRGEEIDYLTFVPDGEPTLDRNLGKLISSLRCLGIPIAVITNASLIDREDVQADLAGANWVSLKVDAVDEKTWRAVDRPYGRLALGSILDGIKAFAKRYTGTLVTETMLVKGGNDTESHIKDLAAFLETVSPSTAYLSVPIRPPASADVRPPDENTITRAFGTMRTKLGSVECLVGYEGNAFSSTGDARRDLLEITAVHPMKKEAVEELLLRTGRSWGVVESLLQEGELVETRYQGETFYLRRLKARKNTDF